MNPIADFIEGVIKPIADVVDNQLDLSGDKALAIKQKIFEVQVSLYEKAMDYENKISELQAGVITAEANSESWIARNWRPITMLTFLILIVNRWTGFSILIGIPQVMIPHDIELKLWDLMKIGLGGYVVGRSAEKIAPSVATALGNLKGN